MAKWKPKPCPFCGGTDIDIIMIIDYFAQCRQCKASRGWYPTPQGAKRAWGTRVEPGCFSLQYPGCPSAVGNQWAGGHAEGWGDCMTAIKRAWNRRAKEKADG